jgi:hypothetical protein
MEFKDKSTSGIILYRIIILGFIGFYVIMETSPHYLYVVIPYLFIEFGITFYNLYDRIIYMIDNR